MQDVIFEGTDKRAGAQSCEVALTFTDCENELGTAFHEIEIKRRVTRDGGSDYYLNGKSCRLKDIQMLFMDTGIGRMAYSFLVQGQIDQILSTDPAERRLIFEEASGITKYKSQRQETLQKLNQATQNLTRLHDVLDPIEARVNLLKSQVKQAHLYKRLHHRAKHLEWAHFAYERDVFINEIALLNTLLTPLNEALAAEKTTLQALQAQITTFQENKNLKQTELKTVQAHLQALQKTQNECVQKQTLSASQVTHTEDRLKKIASELLALKEELDLATTKLHHEKDALLPLKEKLQSSQTHYNTLVADTKPLVDKVRELERTLQAQKIQFQELEKAKQRFEKSFMDQSILLKTLEAQIQHAEEKYSGDALSLNALKEQISLVDEKLQLAQQAKSDAQEKIQASRVELLSKRQDLQKADEELQKATRDHTKLTTELSLLEGWINRFEGASVSAQKALKGEIPNCPKGTVALLKQILDVPECYAESVEKALTFSPDLLLPENFDAFESIWANLSSPTVGSIALAYKIPTNDANPLTLPNHFTPFNDFIKCTEEKFAPWVQHFFRKIFLVENFKIAQEWIQNNPHPDFDLLVTKDGHVIHPNGFAASTHNTQNSVLKKKAHLKTLQLEATSHHTLLDHLQKNRLSLQDALNTAQKNVDESEQAFQKTQTAHQSILAESKILTAELQKLTSLEAKAATDKTALKARLDQIAHQLQALEKEQLISTEAHATKQALIQQLEIECHTLREEQSRKNEALRDAERTLNDTRQQLVLAETNCLHTEKTIERLQHQQKTVLEEESNLKNKLKEYAEILQHSKDSLLPLQEEIAAVETQLKSAEELLKLLDDEWAEAQRDHTALLKTHHENSLKHLDLSKKLNQAESSLQNLKEKAQGEEGVTLEALHQEENLAKTFEAFSHEPSSEDPQNLLLSHNLQDFQAEDATYNWKKLERYLKNLKQEIKALGPVYLDAIQEHDGLVEKRDFLLTQKADLDAAHADLLEAMTQMNKLSSDLFSATFEKIRSHFQNTFQQLFGGGHADITLENPEELLESGIEIIACPPGTRLKNLSLLSGGQKTMTAVALLFSIYLVKPSPFCVLDELDAPLDDANIGRFTHLLRSFTEFSQFLVITHNKRTLSAADILYGVTMPEKGITQMVSLDLTELAPSV